MRLAVLGAGDWARRYHLPALDLLRREGAVEVAGIWNRTTATAAAAARAFGIGRVYGGLGEAVADETLHGFVVLVHSAAAAAIVTGLLPRGLPVFAEKPPGSTYQEARGLADGVKVPNVVAFNRRYMPINVRFKALADELVDPFFAVCHFHRSGRLPGRFVLETGVHGINFMEHLCGPIEEVRTDRGGTAGQGARIAWVTFASGLRGLLELFPSCGSSIERYELHGPHRSIYLACPQSYTSDHPGTIAIHEGGKLVSTIVDDEAAGPLHTLGLLGAYRDFLGAIREGRPTASSFANACNTMRIAEAIEAGDAARLPSAPRADAPAGAGSSAAASTRRSRRTPRGAPAPGKPDTSRRRR